MKILDFFLFCGSFLPSWIRIRNLNADPDPDPATQINADPDPNPKPWEKHMIVNFVKVFEGAKTFLTPKLS